MYLKANRTVLVHKHRKGNITVTSVGTEELAHMEMICAIVHQLTRDLTEEQIKNSPFATYYVDHTTGLYPVAASGVPFTVSYFQSKGDAVADINEDLAADGAILYGQPRCFSPKVPMDLYGNLFCFRIASADHNMIDQSVDHVASQVVYVDIMLDKLAPVVACSYLHIDLGDLFFAVINSMQ